jgi:hypothetical protein
MPVWRTEGPVTIGVDPYVQTDRQREVFDDDLEKAGVLPIYLLVKNSGEHPLSLRRSDITLELPDGYQISPGHQMYQTQSEAIVRMLGRKWPAPALPTVPDVSSGPPQGISEVAVLIPLAPILIPAIVAQQKAQQKENDARIADYLDKEFKDVVLNKDASAHGFVYYLFFFTRGIPTKGKLVLRFVDETDGTSFVVQVPLGG